MSDPVERLYYDDSKTKITESFVAVYKKVILPVEKIEKTEVRHKHWGLYMTLPFCLASFALLFYSVYWFIPVFCVTICALGYVYQTYGEVIVTLDSGKRYLIRMLNLKNRNTAFDIKEALDCAVADFQTRSNAEMLQQSDTMRLRQLDNMLKSTKLEATPEMLALFRKNKSKENNGTQKP